MRFEGKNTLGRRLSSALGIGGGLAIFLIVALTGTCPRAQDRPKRVLMLHSFNHAFPATAVGGDAARGRLLERSLQKLEIDGEFLDLARHPGPEHEERMASFLREKYRHTPPDLIITFGSLALPFILKHRDAIATSVPVVFTAISPATYAAARPPPDVTGILSEFDLEKTLALAEALQPASRRMVFIAGSGAVDRRWQIQARQAAERRAGKFDAIYLFEMSYSALADALKRIPPDSIVVFLTVFTDSNGKTFAPAEVAAALAPLSPAPVYSLYETYLGNGTVGGFIETFGSMGIAAADLALEIMSGKNAATPPPKTNPLQGYRVDLRAMQRWKLREDDLPAGTVVLFKTPTIWEQHRNLVIVAIGISALQTAVAAALLLQRRRRQRAETLLKESEERMTFTAASANLGLWQFDRLTGELWATEHSRTLFGLAKEIPLTRETFLAAILPEDREIAIATLSNISVSDTSAVTDVRVIVAGEQRWIRVRARLHQGNGALRSQVSGIFVDLTDQKTAELEATLQRQEVTHLMRVSVLGELSGAIAHEISQPLTAIQSNAETGLELISTDPPDLAEIRDIFRDIVDDNKRASEVIQRLRSLLKKGETTPVSIDVDELVTATVSLLKNELISRRINVKLDLAGALPLTDADPIQLQQVLLNLVMNAMDAMASTPTLQRLVTVSTLLTPADAIEIHVKDSGPGIQPKDEARVFDPFYTTKSHGLGLGLTICTTIMEAHGGTVRLANAEGGGGVATISLPLRAMMLAAQ